MKVILVWYKNLYLICQKKFVRNILGFFFGNLKIGKYLEFGLKLKKKNNLNSKKIKIFFQFLKTILKYVVL